MPNWCYNMVEFIGDATKLKELGDLFIKLSQKEVETGNAQNPDFIQEPDRYFFDIRWEGEVLYYETKWTPNVIDVKKIAERYCVDYIYNYDERSMYIYGEARSIRGVFSEVYLDQEDFEQIVPNETSDWYLFEGEQWYSEEEILDFLLERKKAQAIQSNC